MQTGGECATGKEASEKDAPWATLDFDVKEPTQVHFTYESDGKTYHAEATADPACDGKKVTYKLDGKVENVPAAITGPRAAGSIVGRRADAGIRIEQQRAAIVGARGGEAGLHAVLLHRP